MLNGGPLISIVTCQSIEREIRFIAEQAGVPFMEQVFPSSCHRDPDGLGKLIKNHIDNSEKKVVFFVAYGNCFKSPFTDKPGVFRVEAMNCASILLGGDTCYEPLCKGSYFLTPNLALNWKPYLLGENLSHIDVKVQARLVKWFKPIERIILIELESDTLLREYESAQQLALMIRKPLVRVAGDLTFLTKQYEQFLETVADRHRSFAENKDVSRKQFKEQAAH